MYKQKGLPGIIIELKSVAQENNSDLKKLAQDAILQINEKHYETELRTHGIEKVFKYGVAFCGKTVEVCIE